MNDEAKNNQASGADTGEWGFWKRLIRRRHYLIDKKLQLNFTMLLIMIGAINAFFFGFIFYFFSEHTALVYKPFLLETGINESFRAIEADMFRKTWATILYGGIFECILIIMLGIFFSHRVAGPLFKIGRAFKEITNGRYPGLIKLRKDDMLKEFAETVNEMIVSLKDRANLK